MCYLLSHYSFPLFKSFFFYLMDIQWEAPRVVQSIICCLQKSCLKEDAKRIRKLKFQRQCKEDALILSQELTM